MAVKILDTDSMLKNKPGNESETHYLLKQVAKAWMWEALGVRIIANEIYGLWSAEAEGIQMYRNIIDVLGVGKRLNGRERMWTMRGVEVKATRSDYRAGFCRGADFTYIMAPQGVVPREEVPKGIGLVEVDMNKLRIRVQPTVGVQGVNVVKRATFRMDERFKTKEQHQKFVITVMQRIAARNTIENLLGRAWVSEDAS